MDPHDLYAWAAAARRAATIEADRRAPRAPGPPPTGAWFVVSEPRLDAELRSVSRIEVVGVGVTGEPECRPVENTAADRMAVASRLVNAATPAAAMEFQLTTDAPVDPGALPLSPRRVTLRLPGDGDPFAVAVERAAPPVLRRPIDLPLLRLAGAPAGASAAMRIEWVRGDTPSHYVNLVFDDTDSGATVAPRVLRLSGSVAAGVTLVRRVDGASLPRCPVLRGRVLEEGEDGHEIGKFELPVVIDESALSGVWLDPRPCDMGAVGDESAVEVGIPFREYGVSADAPIPPLVCLVGPPDAVGRRLPTAVQGARVTGVDRLSDGGGLVRLTVPVAAIHEAGDAGLAVEFSDCPDAAGNPQRIALGARQAGVRVDPSVVRAPLPGDACRILVHATCLVETDVHYPAGTPNAAVAAAVRNATSGPASAPQLACVERQQWEASDIEVVGRSGLADRLVRRFRGEVFISTDLTAVAQAAVPAGVAVVVEIGSVSKRTPAAALRVEFEPVAPLVTAIKARWRPAARHADAVPDVVVFSVLWTGVVPPNAPIAWRALRAARIESEVLTIVSGNADVPLAASGAIEVHARVKRIPKNVLLNLRSVSAWPLAVTLDFEGTGGDGIVVTASVRRDAPWAR